MIEVRATGGRRDPWGKGRPGANGRRGPAEIEEATGGVGHDCRLKDNPPRGFGRIHEVSSQ